MKLIKDYDFTLHYHPGKANTVADALSRKRRTKSVVARMRCSLYVLLGELSDFSFYKGGSGALIYLGSMALEDTLLQKIVKGQKKDKWIQDRIRDIHSFEPDWKVGSDGGLRLRGRLVVPKIPDLKL